MLVAYHAWRCTDRSNQLACSTTSSHCLDIDIGMKRPTKEVVLEGVEIAFSGHSIREKTTHKGHLGAIGELFIAESLSLASGTAMTSKRH